MRELPITFFINLKRTVRSRAEKLPTKTPTKKMERKKGEQEWYDANPSRLSALSAKWMLLQREMSKEMDEFFFSEVNANLNCNKTNKNYINSNWAETESEWTYFIASLLERELVLHSASRVKMMGKFYWAKPKAINDIVRRIVSMSNEFILIGFPQRSIHESNSMRRPNILSRSLESFHTVGPNT